MYNRLEVGFNNDAVSQLRELEIRLDQEGYEREYIYLLQDVAKEIVDFREMNMTVEEIAEIIHENFDEEELREIRCAVDEAMMFFTGDTDYDGTKEQAIEKLVRWQAMNKDELKEELKKRELPVSGSKNQLFERLARTLSIN